MLILERPGTIKNRKFEATDWIKIRTIKSNTTIAGKITLIQDSSIVINKKNEILLTDIAVIYKKRWGFPFLQELFVKAGIPYLVISLINGAIYNDEPIITTDTLIISSSIIAAGIVITPFTSRKFKIDNEKWRVRILDFTE